jgi:hypothetical protein
MEPSFRALIYSRFSLYNSAVNASELSTCGPQQAPIFSCFALSKPASAFAELFFDLRFALEVAFGSLGTGLRVPFD